jgi:N-acetylmuramoyl-L-alanine amidase
VRTVLTIALLFACAAVAQAQWNIVERDKRKYVSLEDVANFYKMRRTVFDGKTFRLVGTGSSIQGGRAGRDVTINGVKYVLCFPMINEGHTTLISAMDVVKIIEPILRPQKIKNATAVKTVVLDAGHGGHDSGARGPLGVEKEAALDVVLRTKRLLEAAGYTVRCTRTSDVFVPLEDRAAYACRFANAVFVSVHFNKSNTGGGTGLETYCLAPRGVPSMDEENLRYSDFVQYKGHARDAENVALATTVHAALVRNLNLPDRGIKRARFVVIKNISIPGILVEGGFMSGTPDHQLIATASYRQKMAESIVEGINRYREAVAGQLQYQRPSVVVSATAPTSVPNLKVTPRSRTDNAASVAQAQEALKSSAGN